MEGEGGKKIPSLCGVSNTSMLLHLIVGDKLDVKVSFVIHKDLIN